MLTKLFASGFSYRRPGLDELLASAGADTVVVTGASTSGCVRATALDAIQHGYRVLVPREAVGDRNRAAHEANLYDLDTKYADVVSVERRARGAGRAAAVIVRDRGRWQVVFQTDHADLSAAAARAWADKGPRHDSLTVAAERHDDGWAAWEQAPRVDRRAGKPVNFLEVDVRSHLAFYRAGIAAITEQDEHAGLLVSMHGAGIYRQRYGLDSGLGLERAAEVQDEVDAFVAEQEARFGGDPSGHRAEYDLLQFYDRFSLHFCMRDAESGGRPSSRATDSSPSGRGTCGSTRTRSSRALPASRCSGTSCPRARARATSSATSCAIRSASRSRSSRADRRLPLPRGIIVYLECVKGSTWSSS